MEDSKGTWQDVGEFSLEECNSARRHARNEASARRTMTRLVRIPSGWKILAYFPATQDDESEAAWLTYKYEDYGEQLGHDEQHHVEPSDKDDEERRDILSDFYETQDEWSRSIEDGWPY